MPLKKIYLPTQCCFVTTNTVNKKWVFGEFKNGIYLPNDKLCHVVIDILNNARDIFEFLLHGYIIMPDHFHVILTTAENEFSATRSGKSRESIRVGLPSPKRLRAGRRRFIFAIRK